MCTSVYAFSNITVSINLHIFAGNKELLQCDSNWKKLINSYGSKGCVEFGEEDDDEDINE